MTEIKGDIPEIIRLQLRKPTRWGWELSTFKPSRNVALPTIQLYNYKGQLLVEAKDNGETERSWRSSTIQNKGSAANAERESGAPAAGHLKRSRSDTLGRGSSANISRNKFESINRKDGNRQPNNKIKSFVASLDNSATKATADIAPENRGSEGKATKVITEIEGRTENSRNSLKKSKSDASGRKGNLPIEPAIYKRNSFQTFQEFVEKAEARRHRRSKSEELYMKRLRSSEESVKRAELDGYINFIRPNIPHHKSQDKVNKSKKLLATAETVSVADNNATALAVSDIKPKKYRTRTSSAGTLIISEESFNDAQHGRRRRNVTDLDRALFGRKNLRVQSEERKCDIGVNVTGLGDGIPPVNGPIDSISGRAAFKSYPAIVQNGTWDKPSSGTQTLDTHRRWRHGEVQKYNTIETSSGVPNAIQNKSHFAKYVRHDSDPNSISRRYAFNQNMDIAHSHSSGTLQDGGNHHRISNIRDDPVNMISSKRKTNPPGNNFGSSYAATKTLGFGKYVRPISDPTSWISRRYAFNSQQGQPEVGSQRKVKYSDGLDKSADGGVNATGIAGHVRQISDPTGSISRRYPSNPHSGVTKTGGENTSSNGLGNSTNIDELASEVARRISDFTSSISRRHLPNRHSTTIPDISNREGVQRRTDEATGKPATDPGASLFHSPGDDVLPPRVPPNDGIGEDPNDGCDYVVQEPITPGTPSESRKSSVPIIEKLNRMERGKACGRRDGDGSASSSTAIDAGSRTKGHLIKDHSKHKGSVGGGDTDLLQLVRRLSSNDHVKMGANVSRHSAKGLSGRRSQSSGSICNGKGRHPDGKICSSLPSYLDDRQSNGCNNNHRECEKPPIDEVDRIPPLGDGAPLHWKFSDTQTALCDQGYGSERSPEEEYPPPLPDHDQQCHHHLEPHACYPFITPDSTFVVKLTKGTRGLGLSVTGGIDSTGSWPGLIRIKRLFPHQPASACGLLNVGDLLLQANGITLTGLTNYEALEVLRTAPNQVDLKVCRPPPDVLNCVSPISEVPPPPPRREPPCTLNLSSAIYSTPEDDYYHGEFEVTLKKIHGSLGFTLRKEDDSALGHYVRALVREPALTDGRIKAGDKIIAVNDVEISPMSHEQAVQFLRQCSEVVRLRLYRDSAQTPVAALSPSETTPRTSFSRKAHLRQEAVDMLNDIAVRKLIPGNQDIYRRSLSPNASPRRLRRQNCPSDASQMTESSAKYLINDEQFHEGLLQKCSHPFDDDAFNSLFSIESDEGDKPHRPCSLDLYNPNQTPVAARKPRFNFSLAHNAYELNNLDPEVLDAPNLTYNLGNDDVKSTDVEVGDSFLQEPASMPHIPIDNPTFSYKNPAYQSAHPQIGFDTVDSAAAATKASGKLDDTNMKKWKNIALQDESESKSEIDTDQMPMKEEYEVLAIELNRGWNSRLGFSLQGAAGVTYVSAVHADSVAAKDGRLKPGDRVIKVNDESVEHMSTGEIIDLLRIVRGPVCIVVSRVKSNEDCPKSNAEN